MENLLFHFCSVPPLAPGQQGPVRGRDAFSRAPCPAMEPGECRTTHSDPTSRRTGFRVGPLCFTSLPHRGYVGNSPGPAFSVDDSCLEFGPGNSHVVLRPRPGYVPKVPNTPFRDQVVNLQALPREEADPRTSDQLFVCFGGQQKGKAVSKQSLAHWIVEAIVLAYQARCLPCPLGVRAHFTRGIASSWAWRGVPL